MGELDLFRLNAAPRIILKHTPLVLALCQIRFNTLFGITKEDLEAFYRSIQPKYPIAAGLETIEVTIGTEPAGMSIGKEQRRTPQWHFTDQDDNWKIVLSQNFLSLETRIYKHFDEFLERLEEVIEALIEHINPTHIARIGLRYINEIRSKVLREKFNWSTVINTQLLGPLVVSDLIDQATQVTSFQQLNLRYTEEVGVNIHHGLFPSGTTVQAHKESQEINDPFYLLDFDVFRDFPFPYVLNIDPGTINRFVKEYHDIIYQLFRWSVMEDYISALED